MNYRRELFTGYSPELQNLFGPFIQEANKFVERNQGHIATLYTSPDDMQVWANELVNLAQTLVSELRTLGTRPFSFYKSILVPPREAAEKLREKTMQVSVTDTAGVEGPGMAHHGGTCYYIFDKASTSIENATDHPRTLLVMLQHLPKGKNTGNEIHGVKIEDDKLIATKDVGGMELHVPLLPDTTFFNNGKEVHPNPYEGVVTIPGDQHSLVRYSGSAINLIIMAYGAGLGKKVDPKLLSQGIYQLYPEPVQLPLGKYSGIQRHIIF